MPDRPDVAPHPVRRRLLVAVGLLPPLSGLVEPLWAANDAGRAIAVLYPDIGEPYRSVFTTIIEGVEDEARGQVAAYPVGAQAHAQEIAAELRRREIRVVIALGRHGLKLAATLPAPLGVIAGGVLSVPESEAAASPIYSLAPDPALLFARLKVLLPAVRRVNVVFDPRQNAWLMRLARDGARALGLELDASEAGDLKTAVRLYRETLGSADARAQALWLPQDPTTVEEDTVLPLVLRESWNQNLPVFSSSLGHVKRGALFALYPDNLNLGRSLAQSALALLASGSRNGAAGVLPLRDVLMAANTRTAAHLGVDLRRSALRISALYPEP